MAVVARGTRRRVLRALPSTARAGSVLAVVLVVLATVAGGLAAMSLLGGKATVEDLVRACLKKTG